MLWMVVMLKDELGRIHVVVIDRGHEFVLQYVLVRLLDHRAVQLAHESGAVNGHTAPDHDRSTSMIDRLFDCSPFQTVHVASPAPRTPVRAEPIYFGLVRPNNVFPVSNRPELVAFCE